MSMMQPDVGAGPVGVGGVGQSMPDPAAADDGSGLPAPTWSTSVAAMTGSTDDMARRLKLIRQFAPTLANQRVDIANQLASSNLSDDELIQQTNAVMGSAVTQQEAQAISHLPAADKAAAWGRMTPDRQQAFRQLGFDFGQVHTAGPSGSGILGSLWHGATGAVAGLGGMLKDDVGLALHGIGAPLRAVQHTARWGKYLEENGTFDGAWSRTANGERWFQPKAVSEASGLVGHDPAKLLIAQRLAGGDTVEDLVKASGAAPGSKEYADTYRALVDLTGDDNMQLAVASLDAGKYSFGRAMASGFGIDPRVAPGLHRAVSGSFDALFDLVLDPLIIGGKVSKGFRAAKYGVDLLEGAPTLAKFGLEGDQLGRLDEIANATKAERLDALNLGRSGEYFRRLGQLDANPVQRYLTMVADHYAVEGQRGVPMISELAQADPHIAKVLPDLSNWNLLLKNEAGLADTAAELSAKGAGISQPSDVARFLSDSMGTADIMRGRWGSYLHRGVEMPHLTRLQSAKVAAKIGLKSTIDFLADELPDFRPDIFDTTLRGAPSGKALDAAARQFSSGVATLGLEDPGVVARVQSAGAEAVQRLLRPAARIFQGVTTLQPTQNVLQLAGEATFEGLDRFLAFGMGGDERAALANRFFASAPGARLKLLRGAIVGMAERAGIMDTEAGREFVDNVARGGLQQYAPNGADVMDTAFGLTRQGIMPKADMAFGAGLPGMAEWQGMAGQARRLSLTHAIFGSAPSSMADAFLSRYWKPSVLLRIGFIPRVAGEEALGAVARLGGAFLPGNWAGAIGGHPDDITLKPLAAMHDVLTNGIPTDYADFVEAGRVAAGRKAATMSDSDLWKLGQEAMSNRQRGQAMLARFVEYSGRKVTPLVRAGARGVQAGFTTLGALGDAGLAEGIGRKLAGGDLQTELEVGSRVARAQEASAATQLGKAVNQAGETFRPGEGRVIDLPRSEIEARLKMAKRFTGDPRVDDAFARGLAGGVGSISSNRMNLVAAGDDPRITVLDRGPGHADPTELRLRPVGSQYETYHVDPQADADYGLHSVMFPHIQSWQIGRMSDDPVMTAAAHAASAYIAPRQAEELARVMGVQDGFAYARDVRRAYAAAPPDVQAAVRELLSDRDAARSAEAVDVIRSTRKIPEDQRQLLLDWQSKMGELTPGTSNMLAVDVAKAHGAVLGQLDRLAPQITVRAQEGGRGLLADLAGTPDATEENARLALELSRPQARPVPAAAVPRGSEAPPVEEWGPGIFPMEGQPGIAHFQDPYKAVSDRHHFVYYDEQGKAGGYLMVDRPPQTSPDQLLAELRDVYPDYSEEELQRVAGQVANRGELMVNVRPDLRRQGIGTALYAEAEKAGIPVEDISGQHGTLSDAGAAFRQGRLAKRFAAQAAEEERARQIINRLESGDRSAIDEATREATRRRLLAPDMAPYREASLRNVQTSDGRLLRSPVPARHARLYGILADVDAFEGLSQADRAAALSGVRDKRLVPIVNALIDEGTRMALSPRQLADIRSSTGRSLLTPISSVVMEDPQLARQLSEAMGQAMVGAGVHPGMIEPQVGEMDIHRHLLGEHTSPVNADLGIYQGGAGVLAKLAPAGDTVTHEELINDWVDKLLQLQEHRMRSRLDGRVLHEVTRPVADGDWGAHLLGRLDRRELPATEIGPKYEVAHEGIWSKITNWGFNKVLGPGIDAAIRAPLFAEHYMQATKDLAGLERTFVDADLDRQARALLAKKGLGVDATREAMRDLNIDGLNMRNGEWPASETVRRHLPDHLAGLTDDELLRISRWASRSANESFVAASAAAHDEIAGRVFDEDGQLVQTTRRRGPLNDATAQWMTERGIPPRATYDLFTKEMPRNVWHPHLNEDLVDVNKLRAQLPDGLAGLTDGQIHLLRTWHSNLESAEQLAHDVAIDRATNEIVPYIHDHHVRSQFQAWTRHFMPFEFAEEQFLKRWARTMVHSPEALEKGMLTLNGLRHSGVVQKDEYGNDVFVYPGSAAVTRVLGRGIELITGKPYTLPIGVPLTGAVKYTVPGLDHEGLPGTSPLVGVALGGLRRRFREFDNVEAAISGERGAGHSFWDQLIPAPAMKLYHFYADDPDRDAKLGSANMSVLAMMAAKDADHVKATGQHLYPGLDPAATEADLEAFISRSTNYTRTMMLARGLMGFGVPASPAPMFPGDLHPQLVKLMAAFPNDPGAAFAEFIHQFPDAQPYEIFGTKSKSGAPLPATVAVGNFLRNNEEFVNRYKSAGAWFLPQSSAQDEASRSTYHRLVADGLRVHKGPLEWMKDMYFTSAAPTYFDSRDLHDQAMTRLKNNPMAREKERASWSEWEKQYFTQNPIFAASLGTSDRKQQRDETLREMRLALNDPSMPETPHAQAIGDLVRGYDAYQAALTRLGARRDTMSMQRRHTIQTSFARWITGYTQANPDSRAFYERVIKPDLRIPNLSEIEVA